MEKSKKCRVCEETKLISFFTKNKTYKDGYETKCKACYKEYRLNRIKNAKIPTKKKCRLCDKTKQISDFGINNTYKDGYENRCKECRNEYAAKQRDKHRENINKRYTDRYHSDEEFRKHRIQTGKKVRDRRRELYPEKIILTSAKARAKNKQLDFNLDLEDIIIPEYCPILNIKLEKGNNEQLPGSPSLDRIDLTKGYIKGNVSVISSKANLMKSNASLEELALFCENIINYVTGEDIVRTAENDESVELEDKEPLG